jgi:lysophospholipase L1-like esterase
MHMIARFARAAVAAALTTAAITIACIPAQAQNEPVTDPGRHVLAEPGDVSKPTVFFIGDSTVRNGRGDGAGGQWGWADLVADHFDTARINVVNRALGGRSSRTYITQGYWDELLPLLKEGDFVVIQFGHNDQSPVNDSTRARGTIHGVGDETEEIENLLTGEREVVHTFGWYLRKYVEDARAGGATPILVSLVPRNQWVDGRLVRNRDDWAGWTRRVAELTGATFVDLNDHIADEYERLGPARVQPLFQGDHTHTSRAGAELNARTWVDGVREHPLAEYLIE